ncbi:MAG TPA: M14 family metallopeptidase [Burkholderiaceae bacterium]|nr:M14 family metallopeptidase [Burkholderiaceae bacterium]
MIEVGTAFSGTYAEARIKFLEAAAIASLQINSFNHPLPGKDGETLAMDTALQLPASGKASDKLLILSSACHGVEGYCGSGVQVYALHDAEWLAHARAHDVTVLYIHALNPYGFSHIRRTTHENVDLNRNFHDFSKPLPVNTAYREVADMLMPDHWPPNADNMAQLQAYIAKHGEFAFQAAVSGGQHEYPKGLFYGGIAPTWSNVTLRNVLNQHATGVKKVGWIDLHTGLGPSGLGERIFAGKDDAAALERTRRWWAGAQKADGTYETPITSFYDGTSTSAKLTGLMWSAAEDAFPNAQCTAIAMEYGTVPPLQVNMAMRAENWLHHNPSHPDATPVMARKIKQDMLDAFFTNTDTWKTQIVTQARQSLFQAVAGLNS